MKAGRVGDDQGVGRGGEGARRRVAERCDFLPGDAERAAPAQPVRRLARGDAHPPFPVPPCQSDPVRARHIDERATIRSNVGQGEPGLDRRLEGVGVQGGLRVRLARHRAGQDRLQVADRLRVVAADVAKQAAPCGVRQQQAQRRHPVQGGGIEGEAAGDRVALDGLARRSPEDLRLSQQLGELGLRQEVPDSDEAVAREGGHVLGRDQPRQPAAAQRG